MTKPTQIPASVVLGLAEWLINDPQFRAHFMRRDYPWRYCSRETLIKELSNSLTAALDAFNWRNDDKDNPS